MQRPSTASLMNRLNTNDNRRNTSQDFEEAELLRFRIMARSINQETLKGEWFANKLLEAKRLYRQIIEAGDYRALCSTPDNIKGVLGGLYSLNDLLRQAGLWKEEDASYFKEKFDAAVLAGDVNCVYVKEKLAKRQNKMELDKQSDEESAGLDEELPSTDEEIDELDRPRGPSLSRI